MLINIFSLVVLLLLAYAGYTDYKTLKIPNIVPILITVLAIAKMTITYTVSDSLFAVAVIAMPILLIATATNGMGGGDVKLITAIMLYLGFWQGVTVLLVGFILFAVFLKLKKRKETYLAPFLLIGYCANMFFYY